MKAQRSLRIDARQEGLEPGYRQASLPALAISPEPAIEGVTNGNPAA
jgi:hypothetical protein